MRWPHWSNHDARGARAPISSFVSRNLSPGTHIGTLWWQIARYRAVRFYWAAWSLDGNDPLEGGNKDLPPAR